MKRLVQPASLGTPEQTDHALKVVQFFRHGSAGDEDVAVGTSFDDGLVDFDVLVLRLVSFIDDDAIEQADQLVLVVGHAVVTSQNVVKLLQLASREDYEPRRLGHIYDI